MCQRKNTRNTYINYDIITTYGKVTVNITIHLKHHKKTKKTKHTAEFLSFKVAS